MAALEDFAVGSQHRGCGLELRPHPREELTGAHRARLARQVEEKPALPVPHEGPPTVRKLAEALDVDPVDLLDDE
jgi:hypothetical protein